MILARCRQTKAAKKTKPAKTKARKQTPTRRTPQKMMTMKRVPMKLANLIKHRPGWKYLVPVPEKENGRK